MTVVPPITQTISPLTALPGIIEEDYRESVDNLVETELPLNSVEMQEVITQLNTSIDSINDVIDETNTNAQEAWNSKKEALASANLAETYSIASQQSYQNTVTLLENTDITGTAGYTIAAVDDLMSRQRNLQLVGLNLI